MTDPLTLGSAYSGMKNIYEGLASLLKLKISTEVQAKVIELQSQASSAYQDALSSQLIQADLQKRVAELEQEIARMENWEAEKLRYELKEVLSGSFAYALKADTNAPEPPHLICPNCYQKGRKSILQKINLLDIGCPECELKIQSREEPPTMIASIPRARSWMDDF
jgi:Zn finger protein HypA/HybF involved in hydrogenase expression